MGQLSHFIEVLCRELRLIRVKLPWTQANIATLYFGGGTPSLHSAKEIQDVIATITSLWELSEDVEITLETNPGTVDETKLRALFTAGVNRLSIGAQSFSQRKLDLLYRDHSVASISACVTAARAAGFKNLSLDLIFGLPGETSSEWKTDLERVLALDPEHVSLYNLEYHEHTPFYRWKRQGKLTPLAEDFEADLYLLTHERLTEAGFEHYEVSNFARPGFRSRHNRAYWLGAPYLGCGPSAHSFDGLQTRFKNISDDVAWMRAINADNLAHEPSTILTARDQSEEWISLCLRRSEGINRELALKALGAKPTELLWQQAAALPAETRILTAENFSLTPAGWFKENSILSHLFTTS